jgi:hypothetical protein
METKLQKKILGRAIKSYQFYKMQHPVLNRKIVNGFIWLEGLRIRIENGKFFTMNTDGKKEGVILKTSSDYKVIKRLIARWFSTYRKNGIASYANSTMREACQQAQYNLRIKAIQNGRISFNHYYSAS